MVFSLQILGRLQARARGYGLAAIVVSGAGLAALTGCGQKGPLFMPVLPPAPAALVSPANPEATAVSRPAPAASTATP